MKNRDLSRELCNYCRREADGRLRAVVHYNSQEHDPIFTREDIPRQVQMDDDTRSMFRIPYVQINETIWRISRIAPTLGNPGVATFSFGKILIMLFPITTREGIVVSLDYDGELPNGFLSGCEGIVYGST